MNRYPNFIAPEVSTYGEPTPSQTDWVSVIGWAVVVVGVGFCALKFFGVV